MLGASAKPAAMAVPIICLQLYMFCSLQSFDKNDLEFFTFQSFFLEKKTLGMIIEKDFKFVFTFVSFHKIAAAHQTRKILWKVSTNQLTSVSQSQENINLM